jgi:hypothetical protein
MLFFIIGLIVWGFIVGGLARLALPGPDPTGTRRSAWVSQAP